ncbi:MAG: RluA family pseudouridine synthase [Phycisphaerales bacterium]|nr:RluA family pseudouridine synthase [Phycisphaerales bacterium]
MKRPPSLEILWQTDRLIAVLKPAGLATIPGRAETDSVLEQVARLTGLPHTGKDDPRIRVVHRLDKDTSGVMLFAKDKDAQRHLSHQFQNNTVEKEYLAITFGHPPAQSGEVDGPLCVNPGSKTRMMISQSGRPARTLWQVEETFGEYSLVRCFPKTGKTHQIRVHLLSIGLPLAVDILYNPPKAPAIPGVFLSQFKRGYRWTRGERERPLIDRLTLHAEKLRFQNVTGETVELIAPLPKDFRATLNQLRNHGKR